jgi:hypothetical protein
VLSATFCRVFSEFNYAACFYTELRYAECLLFLQSIVMLSGRMQNVVMPNAVMLNVNYFSVVFFLLLF